MLSKHFICIIFSGVQDIFNTFRVLLALQKNWEGAEERSPDL